jgi:ParB family chromosome partitioning protein
MSRLRKSFGFDESIADRLAEAERGQPESRRPSTMGAIIRDTAEKSADRFADAEEVERKKLLYAARMAELERRSLDLHLVDVNEIRIDGYTRDRTSLDQDELEELKASIRMSGLNNPIRVDRAPDGALLLNQGLRRLMAFRELRKEDEGSTAWNEIPALVSPLESREASYRRMVEENTIRADISFGELAVLALAYAEEMEVSTEDAISALFVSMHRTKRSYIRKAAKVMEVLGDVVEHPSIHKRRTLEALAKKLADEAFAERLRDALSEMKGQTAAQEEQALERASRGFVPGGDRPKPRPTGDKFVHNDANSGRRFNVQIGEDRLVISAKGLGTTLSRENVIAAIDQFLARRG